MAGYRVTVENMVTGEQRIKECEGVLAVYLLRRGGA